MRNEDPDNVPIASSSTRLRTTPDPFLVVCRCFSLITAVTAILCIAVNILSAVRSFKNEADVYISYILFSTCICILVYMRICMLSICLRMSIEHVLMIVMWWRMLCRYSTGYFGVMLWLLHFSWFLRKQNGDLSSDFGRFSFFVLSCEILKTNIIIYI